MPCWYQHSNVHLFWIGVLTHFVTPGACTQADVWAAYERLNGVKDRNRHVIREFEACEDCIYSTLCNGVPVPGREDGLCGACAALLAKEQGSSLLAARAARAAIRNAQYVEQDGASVRPVGPRDAPACQAPIGACGTEEQHRRLASAAAERG